MSYLQNQIKNIFKFRMLSFLIVAFLYLFFCVQISFSQIDFNPINCVSVSNKQKSLVDLLFVKPLNDEQNSKLLVKKKGPRIKDLVKTIINDTTIAQDRIISIRQCNYEHCLYLELKDYTKPISITAYNLLGKKVLDVYEGIPKFKNADSPYEIESSQLPNGIYICVVKGEDFKLNAKFYVSR